MELFQHKVNQFDKQLLHFIEENLKTEEVIAIIEKDKLCNAADRSNDTLLHVAARSKNSEVAKYLIESGSRFDERNNCGETPLMLAAESNCEAIVKILIEAGAVIRLLDRHSKPEFATFYSGMNKLDNLQKCIKIIEKYLPHDNEGLADKILQNRWSLQHAILLKNVAVTRKIIDNYSNNINEKNQLGVTALDVALYSLDVENVKLLLNYNAIVNVENAFDYLYNCRESCELAREKLEILKILFERVDSNSIIGNDRERYDCLIYSIFARQDKEVVKLLLQHKRLLFTNRLKDTALRALVTNRNPGIIELLRGKKKFNVNTCKNRDKETPLMVAAQDGNVHAMEYLLDVGADIEAVNFLDFSPLFFAHQGSFACEGEPEKCTQLLLERGANVQWVNNKRALPTIIDAILEYETFETTGEIVLAHLALQERLGTPINQVISSKINAHDELKSNFELSKKLLSMKIFQSTTLFDLLTESDRQVERRVRNEEFTLKLQDVSKQIEKSYYFNNLLQKRLKTANLMIEMRKKAVPFICKFMDIDYSRFPVIVDDIVSYLVLRDIESLIDALS